MKLTIDCGNLGERLPDEMYGIFFEDISRAADGGINAEEIVNNSFENEYIDYDGAPPRTTPAIKSDRAYGWTMFDCEVTEGGLTEWAHCLTAKKGGYAYNRGYGFGDSPYGIPAYPAVYAFSVYAEGEGTLGVSLETETGVLAETSVCVSGGWKKYAAALPCGVKAYARLKLSFGGAMRIEYVSLIPDDVYGDAALWTGGRLKTRLVEALRELQPGFVRFPGGCVVEGDVDFSNLYDWRDTVGEPAYRKPRANVWRYLQSYAVGFYEYFLLSEALGAQPLPVLHCGLLCQVRTGDRGNGYVRIRPGTEDFTRKVVDHAAELIYYAKGDPDSADEREAKWAGLRCASGHPSPFELTYLGIGNENWGEEYFENLEACLQALRAYGRCGQRIDLLKTFGITIVTCSGVDISPQDTNPSWKRIEAMDGKMICDEHVYNSYAWFIDNAHRYDGYARGDKKVFMGEYAMHTLSDGRGRLTGKNSTASAIAEAAFLTGCENNCDVVRMTCYAPLFAKTGSVNWTPDLIWFNDYDVMRTPNYYVQKLMSESAKGRIVKGVNPTDKENAGGLLFRSDGGRAALKRVTVADRKGNALYEHDFKNGLGDWKVLPGRSARLEKEALLLEENGGVWLEGEYADCDAVFEFEKRTEAGEIAAGVGVRGAGEAFSLRMAMGEDVWFVKTVDGLPTAVERLGKAPRPAEAALRLRYEAEKLTAFADDEPIAHKRIWRTGERVFASANLDGETLYLKVVNASAQPEPLEGVVIGHKSGRASVVVLGGEPEGENEIGDREGFCERVTPVTETIDVKDGLRYTLKPYSLTIFKF